MNKAQFAEKVIRRMQAATEKKKLEAEIDKLDADIIKYIKSRGKLGGKDNKSLIVYCDDHKVSLISITQYNPDREKLQKALGNDYNQYLKPNSYYRIDIR